MEFNLAQVHEAIGAAIPDRECIVFRDRRLSWADVTERTRRLANTLAEEGLGARREGRAGLQGHESHEDHLAIYCYNGNEYLESMVGAFKARLGPVNVNYRYVAEELRYLLDNSRAKAIVYHSQFAPTLAEVLPDLPELRVLLQVADESGNELLPGARWYEDALAAASPDLPACAADWSPDDLYILYTGGTTGMPKGVLWRQHDIFMSVMGGAVSGAPHESIESVVEAAKGGSMRVMPAAPFMHGAGHWIAFLAMDGGNTVVIQDEVRRLDAKDVLTLIERERISFLQIVGDAFGRPILDEIEAGSYDLSSLFIILSGGAALNSSLKERFLAAIPHAMILDGMGSSEGGGQMTQVTTAGSDITTGTFTPAPGTCVVSEDFSRVLPPGSDEIGWVAKLGNVPLGYLGDAEKSARTFPMIDGQRYSVPGDRGRQHADGIVEMLGRDSVTINSGGEKIFAEEVEAALGHHPDVYDVVVCGRESEQWGQEVVAIVQLRDDVHPSKNVEQALLDECAKHIARYKFPKRFIFVDTVVRSPAGKADYRWAKEVAASS
ncbi:MAG TPA: acyl-CoA synthetase [Acidimicrobiales bacterium]|jgi:fatty-acyl-CoA synthase|nr:acyl-CoA synthetase [Acidimicrobiales bacterium]